MELNRLFQLLLGVASAALFGPWFAVNLEPIPSATLKSFATQLGAALMVIGGVLQAVAIVRHGRWWLPLLAGLPLVFWWPALLPVIFHGSRLILGDWWGPMSKRPPSASWSASRRPSCGSS